MNLVSKFATAAQHHYDGSITEAKPVSLNVAPTPDVSVGPAAVTSTFNPKLGA